MADILPFSKEPEKKPQDKRHCEEIASMFEDIAKSYNPGKYAPVMPAKQPEERER